MKRCLRAFSGVIILFLISICIMIVYYTVELPDSFNLTRGSVLKIESIATISSTPTNEDIDVQSSSSKIMPITEVSTLKLFGVIPIKNVEVNTVETQLLVPSGEPFGIKLTMDGVMVIGIGEVDSKESLHSSPAKDSGIQKGDIILSLNGTEVDSNKELQSIISESDGDTLEVVLRRDDEEIETSVTPVYSESSQTYEAGIWVRDSSAGIGTITYYKADGTSFAGLGHPVCDVDTGEIVPISSGEVASVNINGVKSGVAGSPGELIGSFISTESIGEISLNNSYGIFGVMDNQVSLDNAIPMGFKQDISIGEATILTTIDGTSPKEYSIEIEKIDYNSNESSKNMVIRITDEELLSKTGGIVQGMSGSPIIQDGKLIGAVTHVFINDPTKGYAIFCENMVNNGN
ncbi:MAG: SpoIVB peptidase [Ruminococcus sp.]|nr:SpoIVB peptidase [Ruminococcus sp.]MCD7800692.1 SpoIVB peptidase [Ruminococcus sp.]